MFSSFQLQLLSVVAVQLSASLSVFHLTQTRFRDHRAVTAAPRHVRSFADDVDPWFNWGDGDNWGAKQPSIHHNDAKKQGSEISKKKGDDDADPFFNWGDDDPWGERQTSIHHKDAKKQGSKIRKKKEDGRDPSLITKGIKFISKLPQLPESMRDKFYHPELTASERKDKYRLSEGYRTPRNAYSVAAQIIFFGTLDHETLMRALMRYRSDNTISVLHLSSLRPFFPYSTYKSGR